MTEPIVATTLATPLPPALAGPAQYGDHATWIVGAATSVIVTLLWLRRKTSRDSTEITKDRAEQNLVKTLIQERDRAKDDARAAWDRRTKDAEEIATLRQMNLSLGRDIERMAKQVNDLQQRLDMVSSALTLLKPDFIPPPPAPI